MTALKLTLHRQWFDDIASGSKKIEYREIKPYWITRLEGKTFDEVHFRNGYNTNAPFMRIECLGINRNHQYYQIHLGQILEVRRPSA